MHVQVALMKTTCYGNTQDCILYIPLDHMSGTTSTWTMRFLISPSSKKPTTPLIVLFVWSTVDWPVSICYCRAMCFGKITVFPEFPLLLMCETTPSINVELSRLLRSNDERLCIPLYEKTAVAVF